jgi:hypothetical protein
MHPTNVQNKDKIISRFLWNPNFSPTIIYIGDWVSPQKRRNEKDISWVYKITNINPNYLEAKEYTKEATNGLLKKTSPKEIKLLNNDLVLIKVFYQDRVGEIFKTFKDRVDYPKVTNLWFFGFGFIKELPWDPSECTWKDFPSLGAAPFFSYTSKRGYQILSTYQ